MEEQKIVRRILSNPSQNNETVENYSNNNTTPVVSNKTGLDKYSDIYGDNLEKYINEKIALMENHLLFNGNTTPSFYELDLALTQYESVLFALTTLYATAKYESELAKEKYTEFFADKYMEIRNTYNTIDLKKAQWLSSTELDATVRVKYKDELARLKLDSIEKDAERSTIERLIKSWESYQFILQQLSKNSIAEAQINGSVKFDLRRGDEPDLM